MNYEFDVIIIGAGIAGLTSALKLAESGLRIGIVTRENDPQISNTFWAQGGIIYPDAMDELLVSDIVKASSATSNPLACKALAEKSGPILKEVLLDKAQVPFQRDALGDLVFTKEAAHSKSRILFTGDYTGKAILQSLFRYVFDKNRFPNIELITNHTAIDLLTPLHHGTELNQRYEENKVIGCYLLNQKTQQVHQAFAKMTILASGGIGALYLHHSNAEGARGDGQAMARRAQAQLINMEFIQFHPTTFYDRSGHRRFLISEAVRGEGGVLLNDQGQAFMANYHPERELAPRDVVARAILEETIKTVHECVYLDITHKNGDWIKNRFPTIYAHCLQHKIDITKDPIPVVPAAHYTCGGVKTDTLGRTTLKNLYAVGEVACNGLHGANRLASTSLLEGLTFGYMAAEDIVQEIKHEKLYPPHKVKNWESGLDEVDQALIHQDWLTLKSTMWNYVGLIRTLPRLKRASAMFRELYDEIHRFYRHSRPTDELIGLRNAVEVGHQVLLASLRNKESIGCFYRK